MSGPPPSAGDDATGTDGTDRDDASSTADANADDANTDDASPAEDGSGSDRPGRRVDRRRVLRTLVNTGFGVGIGATLERGGVLGDDGGQVTVVYALARPDGGTGGLEARETQVPTEWYDQLARTVQFREELAASDLSGVYDLFVVPGSFDSPASSLSVTVADDPTVDRLVEQVRDFDLELDVSVLDSLPSGDRRGPTPAEPVRVPDVDQGTLPGGVLCSTPASRGTLAPRLYDYATGSEWFATSNHVYGASGTKRTEHAGEPLFVHGVDGKRTVGTVARGYPNEDVVRVAPVDEVRPASAIYDGASVVGQFTQFGLALLRALEEPLEKVGAYSGHTRGQVEGIAGVTCYVGDVCKTGQLKWGDESAMTDGDSGSVNYQSDPFGEGDGVLVGGINNARTWWPGANYAWGTAAYHLADARGLHF